MVRKCSFLRNIVGQRWSVVDRGSERFALVPAPPDQIGPMHDLGYELLRTPSRRSSQNIPSSTTSLDRCSALESRLIRRKWSRILRLFESESDKIGAQRPAFAFQEPLSMQDFLPALQYLTK